MIISRSMLLQVVLFHSFLWLSNTSLCVCVCVYHVFIIHSCVDEHAGCICVLAVVNSAALNKRVPVSLWVTGFPGV